MAIKAIVVPDGITEFHIPDVIPFSEFDWAWHECDGSEPDTVIMKTYVSRYDPRQKCFNAVTRSDGITILPVYYESPDYHLFKDKLL